MVLRTVRFLSTPSARRATYLSFCYLLHTLNFYPRPPRGGRPVVMPTHWLMGYFYPRPPRGGRPVRCCRPACSHHHFYPRPPRGGRQTAVSTAVKGLIFLSTPSARRATLPPPSASTVMRISIHALREEGDWISGPTVRATSYFYPRPPRGGRPGQVAGTDALSNF